jgi:hypothetical protein
MWVKIVQRATALNKDSLAGQKWSNCGTFIANLCHDVSTCVSQKLFMDHFKGPGGPKMTRGPLVGRPWSRTSRTSNRWLKIIVFSVTSKSNYHSYIRHILFVWWQCIIIYKNVANCIPKLTSQRINLKTFLINKIKWLGGL